MSAGDKQKEFNELLGWHLRRKLRQDEGGACPDANLLAAYQEKSLSAEEAAFCKEHFAACARCREILAALKASEGIPAEEPAPQTGPALGHEQTKKRGRPLWWLAPAGAVAAGLLLWVAVREERNVFKPAVPAVETAENRPQPAPPSASMETRTYPSAPVEKHAPDTLDVAKAPARAEPRAKRPEVDTGYAGSFAGNAAAPEKLRRPDVAAVEKKNYERDKRAAAEVTAQAEGRAETEAFRSGLAKSRAEKPAAPPPPPVEAAEAVSSAPQPATPQAKEEAKVSAPAAVGAARVEESAAPQPAAVLEGKVMKDETAGRAAAPAQAPSAVAGGLLRMREENISAADQMKLPPMTVISAPGGRVEWRAGAMGMIQRSTDGGRNWTPQSSGVSADLLAGSAPNELVCWVVGRQGTILLTTDGRNWTKIPAPVATDFSAIAATNARKATVWSRADRQRYSTEDGGLHWTPAPRE